MAAVKAYDTQDLVTALRKKSWRPHDAQNTSSRRSTIDGRTTRRVEYRVSQRRRKMVE